MKRTWAASVFCQFENQLALARRVETGQWEPVTTRIKRNESSLTAASRAVSEHLGANVYFPTIHQLQGAPPGLLLYSEYPISVEEIRQGLLFLGELDTDKIVLGKEYNDIMWTHSDEKLPKDILPQVRSAFPYAIMAAGLVQSIGGVR